MALWTLEQQQAIKPIDQNSFDKFEQLQREVEACDIEQYLGMEFYQEIKRNPDDYEKLFYGGDYEYSGYIYSFNGLVFVCAYLLYARYIRQSYIVDTYSGFVQHTGNDFKQISSGELKNLEARYKEVAGAEWDRCLHYLSSIGQTRFFPSKEKKQFKLGHL